MYRAFSDLHDLFNDVAALAAEMSSNISEFREKIINLRNEIDKKFRADMTEVRNMAIESDFVNYIKYHSDSIAEFLNSLRVDARKLSVSLNINEDTRNRLNNMVINYQGLPAGYTVDESSINLSPSVTGTYLSEYTYDAMKNELKCKLDTDITHYTATNIVKDYVPNCINYVNNATRILKFKAESVVNAAEDNCKSFYDYLASIDDGASQDDLKAMIIKFENLFKDVVDSGYKDITEYYKMAANMAKNYDIINKASAHYHNTLNRTFTF